MILVQWEGPPWSFYRIQGLRARTRAIREETINILKCMCAESHLGHLQAGSIKSKGLGSALIALALIFVVLSMQSFGVSSSQQSEASPYETDSSSPANPQRSGLDLLSLTTSIVSSTGERSFRGPLMGIPVAISGYLGKDKTNLTLVAEGTTDRQGRAAFFLPYGTYVVTFRYTVFISNVTVDLPQVRSVTELDWTVNRRSLRPLTLQFPDEFGTGEVMPGDRLDASYSALDAMPPVIVEVRKDATAGGVSGATHSLEVVDSVQSGSRYWISLTPSYKIPLRDIDAQSGASFSAYWIVVKTRVRPWT